MPFSSAGSPRSEIAVGSSLASLETVTFLGCTEVSTWARVRVFSNVVHIDNHDRTAVGPNRFRNSGHRIGQYRRVYNPRR